MGSLETLPPDQRAVLDLVLARGRSYDDIARLLGIDRAAVRTRALAAFDQLGPDTGIAPESRALITDYLLGQLPERVADQMRERLSQSPYERAWARVLASALGSMAAKPLPEIPDGSRAGAAPATEPEPAHGGDGTGLRKSRPPERGPRRAPRLSDRPSSRRGGAILLGVGALVVVALVVLLIGITGGSSRTHSPTDTAASGTHPTGTSTTPATSTTSPQVQAVSQSNLNPPDGHGTAKGVGVVVKAGNAYGIIIEAQNLPPNNRNAYAAWLYNSPADALRLGFVGQAVKNGKLQVASPLPANAGHYKQLLLTLETQTNPKFPGTVVLQGPFSGVPATG
jgi:Sigma-70, region 4